MKNPSVVVGIEDVKDESREASTDTITGIAELSASSERLVGVVAIRDKVAVSISVVV